MNNKAEVAKPANLNLPNVLTAARIAATPFFIWMLLADAGQGGWWRLGAALFFVLAIASDAVDGHIARSRGLITDLGKLLDPIADKFLTGAAFICLSILAEIPWWVTLVIMAREIAITIHRLLVAHDTVVAAAWMGKLKTVVQAVALVWVLLPIATVFPAFAVTVAGIGWVLVAAALVLTVLSGIDYAVSFIRGKSKQAKE